MRNYVGQVPGTIPRSPGPSTSARNISFHLIQCRSPPSSCPLPECRPHTLLQTLHVLRTGPQSVHNQLDRVILIPVEFHPVDEFLYSPSTRNIQIPFCGDSQTNPYSVPYGSLQGGEYVYLAAIIFVENHSDDFVLSVLLPSGCRSHNSVPPPFLQKGDERNHIFRWLCSMVLLGFLLTVFCFDAYHWTQPSDFIYIRPFQRAEHIACVGGKRV